MLDRDRAVKLACLFGPLVAGILVLNLFGEGINRAFASLFSGSYETLEAGPFRLVLKPESPARAPTVETLDAFMKALPNLDPRLGLRLPNPETERIEVHLLESRDELMSRGLSVAHADLENNGGFFQSAKLAIYLVFNRNENWNREGLLHETTHALMHLSSPEAEWSPWLSEGMAGYFEKSPSDTLGGVSKEDVGAALELVSRSEFLTLSRLLSAGSEDFSSKDNPRYYLASRLLVAFLMQSDTYADRFYAYYIEERRPGETAPDAFTQTIGDPAGVETDWLLWLDGLN